MWQKEFCKCAQVKDVIWGDYSGLYNGPNVITNPYEREAGGSESEKREVTMEMEVRKREI